MNESFDPLRMARENFGYGNWNAPYWFVGPEQGQARDEDRTKRLNAWYEMGCLSLNDCFEYHRRIGESRWHSEPVKLQATWRKLILTLLAFTNKNTDDDSRRAYQKRQWGSSSGESCVIELSGIAAPSLKEKSENEMQLDATFLDERLERILVPIRDGLRKPKFVVIYGTSSPSCQKMWRAINSVTSPIDTTHGERMPFRFLGRTIFAFVGHPTAMGATNVSWIKLGKDLRVHSDRLLH